jgi:dephospho-CoA kinase
MKSGPYLLGLTGSAAMGKSATAEMFAMEGVPVWDADSVVHALYAPGGAAVAPLAGLAPEAVIDGGIDRTVLKGLISRRPGLLADIEALVHPLVAQDRAAFLAGLPPAAGLAVLDIPLLYETGAETAFDGVLVVTAPPDVQKERLMARPGADEASVALILARQMPDAEKRRRADFVIDTSLGRDHARQAVRNIIRQVRRVRNA